MRQADWQHLLDLAHEISATTVTALQSVDRDEHPLAVLEVQQVALTLQVSLSEIVKQKGHLVK